jgi:hypothetical protein
MGNIFLGCLRDISQMGPSTDEMGMKTFKHLLLLLILITISSCGQLMTHRDYLSEMEHDDSSFFNPRRDFPVVAGDTGRDWETASERRQRTPASVSDIQDNKSRNYLNQELRNLEGKQSENSLMLYEKYKPKLLTSSERIYFLKLAPEDRKDYLASRGFLDVEKQPGKTHEEMFALRKSHVITGMSKSDVMYNWGPPAKVEVAGNPSFENERWLYSVNGATKYIYFESGRVQGWE